MPVFGVKNDTPENKLKELITATAGKLNLKGFGSFSNDGGAVFADSESIKITATDTDIAVYFKKAERLPKKYNFGYYASYRDMKKSIDTPNLGDKIGNYPVISPNKAKELLYNGKYVTSAPTAIKKSNKTAQTELVYRFAPWEKYYIPYYRFLVVEESTGNESLEKQGFKSYCAYYVPAVEDKYIANMPLWNGAIN